MTAKSTERSKPEIERHREAVKYLGFTKNAYEIPGIYDEGLTPDDRLNLLLTKPGAELARERMFKNVVKLRERLELLDKGLPNFDEVLKRIITEIAIEDVHENIFDEVQKKKALTFIANLGSKEDQFKGELFNHLDETRRTTTNLFNSIGDRLNGERGQLLTQRQTLLMEFVAATHDLPKLLGGMNAQIDPDHEIIYHEVIGVFLDGQKFTSSKGEIVIGQDKDDVDFIIRLASFHEDIWREEAFADQVDSLQREIDPEEDTDEAVERARTIFHFIDIFGDAIGFDNKNVLVIKDPDAFSTRFIDLYRRHINLPLINEVSGLKEENWTRGKVFRPGWGLHGVSGLTWTFAELTKGWGIDVDPQLIASVELGILGVLQEAITLCEQVIEGVPNNYTVIIPEGSDRETVITNLEKPYAILVNTWERLSAEIL